MPPLIEKLARHASDPAPVSTAIRKFAGEFKKTHQVNLTTFGAPRRLANSMNIGHLAP